MGLDAFIKELNRFPRVGLDTTPFIYQYEDHPDYADLTQALFERIERGKARAFTSTLTVTELLSGPKKSRREDLEQEYRRVLDMLPNLTIVPVTLDIAIQAADLRAKYNMRTPDAIQLATAQVMNCPAFVTNDIHLKRVTETQVLVLQDWIG